MKADAIYRDQIQRHAETHDLRLLHTFEDLGLSGRKGSRRRPQFEDMLSRAEAGEFDVVVVPKLSRFGRSMRENLAAYDRLEAAGVAVAFLDLGIDTSTAAGRLVRNILTAAAEFESDLISERWKDTHAFLARNGRPSGQAAYGYRYDAAKKELVPYSPEVRVVREIFRRYANGEGLREIARDLERRGIRGQRGATRWAPSLGYVLENPTYIGLREWDGGLVEGTWKPIIDRELWDRVQALRKASINGHPASGKGSARSLLSTLLVCGKCGASMWHLGDRYRCSTWLRERGCSSNAVKAAKAEAFVSEAFLERLSEPHRQHAGRRGHHIRGTYMVPDSSERERVQSELRSVERQMQALISMRLASPGKGFDEIMQRQATDLERKRAELEAEAASMVAEMQESARRSERVERMREQIADLPLAWKKASTAQRRDMLGLAIKQVRVVSGDRQVKSFDVAWQPWLTS